ncbi:MAG: hypothetical protein HFI34_07945, partial [Lachnospiraceae bacterium]|nr:hypothetical protein [Lachnospiraceae bacterium]
YGSHESVRINNNESYLTGYSAIKEPTCGYTGVNEECNKYGTTEDITQPWNTQVGYLASTTGNISGIYDMSGGAWEYTMGVLLDSTNTIPCSGREEGFHSGFKGPYCYTTGLFNDGIDFPISRYYDVYEYANVDEEYQHRILGDATGEMGPFYSVTYGNQVKKISSWYKDEASFVLFTGSWFVRSRSYHYGASAGIFTFYDDYGSNNSLLSYRIVLTPQEV